jgi:uncharacterized membrane protein YecN with MAPEG domain
MVTGLYASILTLFFVALSGYIVKGRQKHKVSLQDDNNIELIKRIRAHANFIEYTPLFLILLYLCEKSQLNIAFLHTLGLIFIIGRISHAYGVLFNEKYIDGVFEGHTFFRGRGMELTFATLIIMALYLISLSL